ncbi:MAG: hypothetical protein IBX41_05335 [Methanophagales archaeon]|nr:hypothetical protein [Methanophagales archaeon]
MSAIFVTQSKSDFRLQITVRAYLKFATEGSEFGQRSEVTKPDTLC